MAALGHKRESGPPWRIASHAAGVPPLSGPPDMRRIPTELENEREGRRAYLASWSGSRRRDGGDRPACPALAALVGAHAGGLVKGSARESSRIDAPGIGQSGCRRAQVVNFAPHGKGWDRERISVHMSRAKSTTGRRLPAWAVGSRRRAGHCRNRGPFRARARWTGEGRKHDRGHYGQVRAAGKNELPRLFTDEMAKLLVDLSTRLVHTNWWLARDQVRLAETENKAKKKLVSVTMETSMWREPDGRGPFRARPRWTGE